MSQIHVSVQQIRDTAGVLKQINHDLTQCLSEMLQEMNSLEVNWESETSNTIREKFNALSPHFQQYAQVMDNYIDYLYQTADQYEATENSLRQNAVGIQ